MMDAETWFTAEEAVAAGWADEIEDTKQVAACVSGGLFLFGEVAVDPSKFRAFPKEKIELNEPEKPPDDPPKTTAAAPLEIYQAKIKIHARRAKYL